MNIKVVSPDSLEGFKDFVGFFDQVYAYRDARWKAETELQLPMFTGDSPFAQDRLIRPFIAYQGSTMAARAAAVLDQRPAQKCDQRLGHISMFEALPESRAAVKALIDTACAWLAENGAEAARAGFHPGTFDMPFAIDDYQSLPPMILRQNPACYHALLKEAAFVSEKGWVDYKIKVEPDRIQQYEASVQEARRGGYEIVPLKEIDPAVRARQFTEVFNDAFRAHWGSWPMTEAEGSLIFEAFGPLDALETSSLAYKNGQPVGAILVIPEFSAGADLKPGRTLAESEKLNTLAIGVHQSARGSKLNLALAAQSFLKLAAAGARYLSYTLVYDDNWPSRRTAEKLGASVCANYIVYRRNFRR